MSEPIAYLKGEFVPASQCTLPVFDLGIVMGAAVTDLVRTFHQKAYRLEDHVRRFYQSCKYARITPPVTIEESISISEKLLENNAQQYPDSELTLVFYMSAGEHAVYAGSAGIPEEMKPTYLQHTFPLRSDLWKVSFTEGMHCVTPTARHTPPQCLSSKIKHRNRLHMWIGQQEAQLVDPKSMPLFLDVNGNITETAGSNFVIYRNGQVVSPRRGNVLWGISLVVLEELLDSMGVPFVEQDLQTYDVLNAEEAWMPSTPYCLAPVVRFNGLPIGDGVPGPIWRNLIHRWSDLVGKDIYQEFTGA